MKNKFLSVFLVGLMVLPLVVLMSGANVAFADNDHGKKVSEVAKGLKGTKGEHGKIVSAIARSNDHDDDDDDNNNDNRGRGNAAVGISDARIQALERLIALIQEQIQILLARLNELRGGVNAPLTISSVAASSIATSSVAVNWATNVVATSKVYFSTSSPVIFASAPAVSDSGLVTSHSLNLTGLTASTTYYFVVESVDASSSVTKSSQFSFTTLALVSGPVISSITTSSVASTSATIGWTTDKMATSKIYYSTSSPVNFSTAFVASNSSLVLTHSISLFGLSPNTTYFFIIESADASSTISQSSQFSFLTAL